MHLRYHLKANRPLTPTTPGTYLFSVLKSEVLVVCASALTPLVVEQRGSRREKTGTKTKNLSQMARVNYEQSVELSNRGCRPRWVIFEDHSDIERHRMVVH